MSEIINYPELGFTIKLTPYDYYVEYEIYNIVGECISNNNEKNYYYNRNEYISSDDIVNNVYEAEKFIIGSVKWDGCSNWSFIEEKTSGCMYHFCNKQELENVGKILAECWELTKQHCKKWLE